MKRGHTFIFTQHGLIWCDTHIYAKNKYQALEQFKEKFDYCVEEYRAHGFKYEISYYKGTLVKSSKTKYDKNGNQLYWKVFDYDTGKEVKGR